MILLLYALSLGVAAQALYVFPFNQATADPKKADFGSLLLLFFIFCSLDFCIVCVFCGACVCFHPLDAVPKTSVRTKRALIKQAWARSMLWNVLVIILLGGSVVFGTSLFGSSWLNGD